MAGDEPVTIPELARRLDDRLGDVREDLHDLKVEVAKLVPRELYDAHRQADAAEIRTLKEQVASLESRARWLVAAVVVPILLVVLNWLLTAKGVKS